MNRLMNMYGFSILPYLKRQDARVLSTVNTVMHDSVESRTWQREQTEFVHSINFRRGESNIEGISLTPDENHLLVCDRYNNCVMVFDVRDVDGIYMSGELRGTLVDKYGYPDGQLLYHPSQAVVVPQTGQVVVSEFTKHTVVVFSSIHSDTVVRTLGDGHGRGPRQFRHPSSVAVLDDPDGPIAVVADSYNYRLSLFRIDDGTLLRHMVTAGSADTASGIPPTFPSGPGIRAVTVVPAMMMGNEDALILVTAWVHNCVYVVTRDGDVVGILKGNDSIQLGGLLNSVTVCALTGEVMVTDKVNQRSGAVVAWRLSDGGGLRVVCSGTGDSRNPFPFRNPHGIVASRDGQQLWVADSENERLCLFRL